MFLPFAYRVLLGPLVFLAACGEADVAPRSGGEVDSAGSAIVGGWAATDDQIFATVEIRRSSAVHGFCSGALISPMVVATAAHCAVSEPEAGVVRVATPGSLEVVAGHLSSGLASKDMVRLVVEARVHEGYDHDFIMGRSRAGAGQGGIGSPNDIALLFLNGPFESIPNAPLLSDRDAERLVHHGDLGYVAGYGVYDFDEDLSGELHISDAIIDIIGQRELLTRRPDQMGDSCFGDSGGPFYVPTEHGDFLVGLVSRGRSDVERKCGDGGVYTMLSAYIPWIERTAGDRFAPRLLPETEGVAFRPQGAASYVTPEGAELGRIRSCATTPVGGDPPLQALFFLALVAWAQRRVSGYASPRQWRVHQSGGTGD